jgi:hypothetical protein
MTPASFCQLNAVEQAPDNPIVMGEVLGTEHEIRRLQGRTSRPLKILLLAALFKMPYRVLRCVQATGARAWVLGTPDAKGLAYSRYCEKFCLSNCPIDGNHHPELAEEINQQVAKFGIDMVVPSDAPSTRSLIAIRNLVDVPCFPLPELGEFDLLNNKWQFTKLCRTLGLTCPETQLFPDVQHLRQALDEGRIRFPSIAKPLSMDTGRGCVVLERDNLREKLSEIFYQPILVQDYILGKDVAASVFCRRGEIVTFIAHSYRRATYSACYSETIFNDVQKIMRHLRPDGIFNFDMRLTPERKLFYLECNPRAFFPVANSMLAGINFILPGLPDRGGEVPARLAQPVTVRLPKAMLVTLHKPWQLKGKTWAVLKFVFSDPLPYLREELGLEDTPRNYWRRFSSFARTSRAAY